MTDQETLAHAIVSALQELCSLTNPTTVGLDYGDVLEQITDIRVYGGWLIALTYNGQQWTLSPHIMERYDLAVLPPTSE